jgi:hypothetical protein
MQAFDDLVDLAHLCLKQASLTTNPVVSTELRRLAEEYQKRAAKLDSGKPPVSGEK